MLYDLAALTAAFSIAFSNLLSPAAIRHLGPVVFNCWRLGAALLALLILVAVQGGWKLPSNGQLLALVISGAIGIVIGDSCIYAAIARLGPRRSAVLYTAWAPFAALLGYIILGETLSRTKIFGIGLVVTGILLAIRYRDCKSSGASEETQGSVIVGVLFAVLSGICAASAVLIARPVVANGVDPAAAATIRAAAGLIGLLILSRIPGFKGVRPITASIAVRSAASGLLGMGAGMTLVLFALSERPVGVVSALSSTTPVLILPLLWLINGMRPAFAAWIGAAIAVAGVSLISGAYQAF
jgi:drug/metabolite transporter (DMT)-like permease